MACRACSPPPRVNPKRIEAAAPQEAPELMPSS